MAWTAPRTWVAAEVVTAALLNTHLRDQLKVFNDARVAYTPNFTGWTLGNGTLTGQHVTAGKFITGSLKYVVGSTDTISGTPAFSLPASPKEDSAGPPLGIGSLFDTSTSARVHRFLFQVGTARFQFASEADTRVTATAPWTWATGDIFRAEFAYEAA
jgi:hypothetical protein